MTKRARQRLRIALAVIFCLLFQQMALAAYACPVLQMPSEMTACAEMDMHQVQDNPALCAKHCSPDLSTAADHGKLSVPALTLPPLLFATVLMTPETHVAVQAGIPIARSDPPPRLRYCSLLI